MPSPDPGPDPERAAGLRFSSPPAALGGKFVFLSASIPHRPGWEDRFDPLEITEAVLAAVRAVLGAGGRIIYGGHPAIASVILSAAGDVEQADGPAVLVFQSELYARLIPEATWALEGLGLGEVRLVPAAPWELAEHGSNTESLRALRQAMLDPEAPHRPSAAVFVGGMEGVEEEFRLVRENLPDVPVYPIGRPGGASLALARDLAEGTHRHVAPNDLAWSPDYGSLMDDILKDLTMED